MRALTDKQKAFAKNLIEGMNQTEAAIKAGYAEKQASSQASRMSKDIKIIEYMSFLKSTVEEIFQAETRTALETLIEIMKDKNAPASSRVRASQEILDRAGYSAPHKIKAEIQTTHSGSITTNNQQQIHIIQEIVNRNDEIADTLLRAFRERQQALRAGEDHEEQQS